MFYITVYEAKMGKKDNSLIDPNYVRELIPKGLKVLVGASAGIDSTVCSHFLAVNKDKLGIKMALAYIHHGLRAEADEESLFVNMLAENLRVEFYTRKIEVGKSSGVQARARKLRYEALNEIAKEQGCDLIVTAHNLDDQAETVLFRMLRGAGVTGLCAIRPVVGNIVRPLLGVTRESIEKYAKINDLSFLDDSSNKSSKYTRNRLRHEAIGCLNEIMGFDVRGSLARIAGISRMEAELIDEYTDLDFEKANSDEGLDVEYLKNLSKGRRFGVLRKAVKSAQGKFDTVDLEHINSIEKLVHSVNPSASINVPGGLIAQRNYGKLSIIEDSGPISPPEAIEINGIGTYLYGEYKFVVQKTERGKNMLFEGNQDENIHLNHNDFPVIVRGNLPGDRIALKNAAGSKKLSDLFIDKKVPRGKRSLIPVLVSGKRILWIPGLAKSGDLMGKSPDEEIYQLSFSNNRENFGDNEE